MRRGTEEEKLGRGTFVCTLKNNLAYPFAHVKGIPFGQGKQLAICVHSAFPADVDDAHFAPFEKGVGGQFMFIGREGNRFMNRHSATHNYAINVRVNQVECVRCKELANVKIGPQLVGGHLFDLLLVDWITHFHHFSPFLLSTIFADLSLARESVIPAKAGIHLVYPSGFPQPAPAKAWGGNDNQKYKYSARKHREDGENSAFPASFAVKN
jgi:hypothetical protein